jgi:hypothetical protein
VAQFRLSFNAVINAAQQNSLIVYRNTTPQQTVTCLGSFRSYLPNMVEMCIKPYGPVLSQHTAQFIVYALGQHDWESGADTDNFDVLYLSYSANDEPEVASRECQGITAGDNDIPDSLVLAYIV